MMTDPNGKKRELRNIRTTHCGLSFCALSTRTDSRHGAAKTPMVLSIKRERPLRAKKSLEANSMLPSLRGELVAYFGFKPL
jgi:hypothetical protein